MEHRQPTSTEIRQRIEKVRRKDHRMLLKYQHLILGRIAEVAGKYMPRNDEHIILDVDGEEFVMFIVKTAKRKGYLRPCARPLSTKYDPWAKEVMEYMQSEEEEPFRLSTKTESSKSYAMTAAVQAFQGLYWPMSDYSRAIPREYNEDMVVKEATRWNKSGYKEVLVQFPDGERSWTTHPQIANINVKVDPRWKRVTSHVLRKISAQNLRYDYGFDDVDVACFGGWTVSNKEVSTSLSKHYMHMDLRESKTSIPELKKQANRYARKLLVDYDLLK